MLIRFTEALSALDARIVGTGGAPHALDVTTDTRAIAPGQTFLALRGEHFDGHSFVAKALAAGAACVIVDNAATVPAEACGLVVANTLRAYMMLAALARGQRFGSVIAITGSTGKTTTKAFVRDLIAACGIPVDATPENENNEIGVSKFLLGLTAGDDRSVAVVEMGARHAGDIAPLAQIARPHVGILTNIGEAHLEIMGSREAIAETKWGLFASGARAVIGLADAAARERVATLPQAPQWFGIDDAVVPPNTHAAIVNGTSELVVHEHGGTTRFPIDVRVPGDHNRANIAAAIAGAIAVGIDPVRLAHHIGSLELPHGRYERFAAGDMTIIFDAYNASMSGTLATLAAFAKEHASRRIAVLGSMAELGPDAGTMHERVGNAAAQSHLDVLLVGGAFADAIASGARVAGFPAGSIHPYRDNAHAAELLRAHARTGDVVLLKGSRMYKMEQIAAAFGVNAR